MKKPHTRMGRRRAIVLVAVQLFILGHILWWLASGTTLTPLEPSEAMEFSKEGIVNAGLILFTLAVLATLIFGRYFCGWGCHLLLLQDGCRWLMLKVGIRPRPFRSRTLRLVPMVAFAYMFLWPIVQRLRLGHPAPEMSLQLSTNSFWSTFPGPLESTLTLLVAGFVVIYLLGSKAYCTYACPYGGIFGAIDNFSVGRIRVDDSCKQCGKCTAACSSDVRVHEEVRDFGMVMDPNCMKTMDCIAACPNDALSFSFGKPAVLAKQRADGRKSKIGEPTWPEEIILVVAYAFGFFATHSLYGRFPFLLALGFGMMASFGALTFKRLVQRKDYTFNTKPLKRAGNFTKRGYVHLLLILVSAGLLGHSLWVQQHRWARDAAFAETNFHRSLWLRGEFSIETVSAESKDAMDVAAEEAAWLAEHGLLREDLNPFVDGWNQLFDGSPAGFEKKIQEVLDLRPDFGEVQLQYAYFLMNLQRFHDATVQMDAVSKRDPRYLDARRSAIALQQRLGNTEEADRRIAALEAEGFTPLP